MHRLARDLYPIEAGGRFERTLRGRTELVVTVLSPEEGELSATKFARSTLCMTKRLSAVSSRLDIDRAMLSSVGKNAAYRRVRSRGPEEWSTGRSTLHSDHTGA